MRLIEIIRIIKLIGNLKIRIKIWVKNWILKIIIKMINIIKIYKKNIKFR